MKRLDRLILKSFVGPFFAILLVVIFILMLQLLWLYRSLNSAVVRFSL